MSIKILFFGAAADITGKREITTGDKDTESVGSLIKHLCETFPELKSHRLFSAVNQKHATNEEPVKDGDEIAVFTAVSGG
jgi:molybdopterin converting factor small subunit